MDTLGYITIGITFLAIASLGSLVAIATATVAIKSMYRWATPVIDRIGWLVVR